MEKETPFELPIFNGYVIDKRLKEFRKVFPGRGIEFINFNSERGEKLLREIKKYFSFLYEDY